MKYKEITLQGLATSPGIAIGSVFLFRSLKINVNELLLKIDDLEQEFQYLDRAIRKVTLQIERALRASRNQYGDQFTEIFESQKAFLEDPVLLQEIKEDIEKSKLSAAFVVSKILSEKTDYFIKMENTYFRERAYDIMDLKQKLIHALLGIDTDYNLSKPSIVVADILSPSDTVQFNRNFILGFLTDKGGKTSHAAIMARGLRIPSVVNGQNLSELIGPDSEIILDGFKGSIILNPEPDTISRYTDIKSEHEQFAAELLEEVGIPAVTTDDTRVQVMANIEFVHETADVKTNNADGVGLFRTESIFIEKKVIPSEDEQYELYKNLAEQLDPKPVTIRTIDLGGDKFLDHYSAESEMNPFLGWRAIRFCLDQPDIFKAQLSAIYRASVHGEIHILIPMISSVEEVVQTKQIIEEVKQDLQKKDIPFKKDVPLGIMIETPSAAMMASIFTEYVDYFSIGTNDLTQYVLAIDRTNDKVSKSYTTFNPAVLAFIAKTIQAGNDSNKPVIICGEFAASPEAVPLLLGMGMRHFSMNPFSIANVKKIIRMLNIDDCEKLFNEVRDLHTAQEIEMRCQNFLKSNIKELKFIN